ncbi:MAG: hypothetical protein ACK5XS_11115 [Armatimonadota bacterium]|jgi:hypothetical protein|nr:hypothetical protein CCB81_09205 [Armatimonadetes bacterium Uphvl-Ar2]MCE2938570.1 hypothetical protein [Fimbriimonadaceae bacterium]MCZ8138111.1 hypothetical protein [Fimbriimonadaceae bacterium]
MPRHNHHQGSFFTTLLVLAASCPASGQQSDISAELSRFAEGTISIRSLLSTRPGITGEIIQFVDHNPDSVLSSFGVLALSGSDEYPVALALAKWSQDDNQRIRTTSIISMRTIFKRQIPLGDNRLDSFTVLQDHWRESLEGYVTERYRRTDDFLAYAAAEMLILHGQIEDSHLVSRYLECSLIPFVYYQSALKQLRESSQPWAITLLDRERQKLSDLAGKPGSKEQSDNVMLNPGIVGLQSLASFACLGEIS